MASVGERRSVTLYASEGFRLFLPPSGWRGRGFRWASQVARSSHDSQRPSTGCRGVHFRLHWIPRGSQRPRHTRRRARQMVGRRPCRRTCRLATVRRAARARALSLTQSARRQSDRRSPLSFPARYDRAGRIGPCLCQRVQTSPRDGEGICQGQDESRTRYKRSSAVTSCSGRGTGYGPGIAVACQLFRFGR